MRRSRLPLKRTLLLSTLATVSLFSAGVLAADTSSAAASAGAATTTGPTTAVATASGSSKDSDAAALLTTTAASATGTEADAVSTDSSAAATSYSYPAASVPPTSNAPYMHQSTAPEGTVFIAVGAILGAFGLAVLVWRGVVAYLLHRNIARASLAQHAANEKAAFLPPPAAFYKYPDLGSSGNVGDYGGGNGGGGGGGGIGSATGAAPGRGTRRSQRGPSYSAVPSQTNLFFSPTAAPAPGVSGTVASNRDSHLLPAGFYVAGSASPASPAGLGYASSMGAATMYPELQGLARASPDSPGYGQRTAAMGGHHNASGSTISLGRTPSAVLDDMLDDNPNGFPPNVSAHHRTYSHNSQGGRI